MTSKSKFKIPNKKPRRGNNPHVPGTPYTIDHAAEITCYSRSYLEKRLWGGDIPGEKLGGGWVVDEDWVESQRIPEGAISIREYAEKIDSSRQHVHALIVRGDLEVIKRGPKKWFVLP